MLDFLGCSLKKVLYCCVHGDTENLESLKDERMKGNHKKATNKYIEILLETILPKFVRRKYRHGDKF